MSYAVRLGLLLLLWPLAGVADDREQAASTDRVAEIFSAEGIEGTLMVASVDGRIAHVHNASRSTTRFSPASTFKIPNTLIALDRGVVTAADDRFAWDGIERGVQAWNRDQTLQSAFQVSCVWCYQQIARQIGVAGYEDALRALDYGNRETGEQVDQFWLNGDLTISAVEQIRFLRALVQNSLPYRSDHIDIVKSIMIDPGLQRPVLRAKTGWSGPELHVGWYVGYLEGDDETWLFAMNMRMDTANQAALRKELTLRSLRALGLL